MTPLRQRMLEDMQVRNLSPTLNAATSRMSRDSLVTSVGRPLNWVLRRSQLQVYLTRERKLAPRSLGIAVCALRFLYKVTLKQPWSFDDLIPAPKKPRRLPVVLSPDEVGRALECITAPKHRAVLTTCYAAGLRTRKPSVSVPTDVDSRRMVLRIEQGKGQRNRYVMLSPKLLEVLRESGAQNRPGPATIHPAQLFIFELASTVRSPRATSPASRAILRTAFAGRARRAEQDCTPGHGLQPRSPSVRPRAIARTWP